mgnify:CR=1 FL=1
MQILNVQQLKKEFGDDILFEDVSFSLNDNDRLALIGPNGNGKSTLIKIILNEVDKTSGEVVLAKGTTIGYLSQDVITNLDNNLYDEVESVFSSLIEQEKKLKEMEDEISLNPNNIEFIEEYGIKQNDFLEKGGYNYHYLINMMLSKFGFYKEDLTRTISSFSGGERTKIAFVKLLLIKPNLLILDEPTNHLDISTIEWLEQYLKGYEGALLFISHDRYFIDALANKIVELENKTSSFYKGNYTYYVEEKKLRYEQLLSKYNNQQKEIARLKRFIEFYKPKPRFVARAKDREKKLEHMKIIDKPVTENNFLKLSFQGNVYEGKEIISVKDLTIGYDKPLIKNLNFSLYGKDRIAIMGSNGCGKTTLLDALINHKNILSGEIKYVRNVNVGYIKQHQIDLNPDRTIFEEMQFNFPSLGEKTIYNYLGRFNFDYEDSSKKIAILSGGEKTRIVLAKIMLENYDILVLDEPTNHLDMVTRQALILALQAYQGSIIFVSHDRYFVDELATHLIYVDHQTPYFIKGNFLDFKEQESKLLTISDELVEEKKVEKKVVNKKPSLKLEEQIKKLEEEIKKVKEEQFLEDNYMDYQKMQSLDKKLKELETNLSKLEEEYLQE